VPASNEILNSMSLEFFSIADNLGLARVAVASFAAQVDLTLNELEEIKVAVSEAVSNAIIHGYENSPTELIKIVATRSKGSIIIEVQDMGKGIEDVDKAVQPAYSTDPERMGLGFVFIHSFMDKVIVKTKKDLGTTIIMEKLIKQNACSVQGE
jgi:stage II sporulation protein AB (anti-sigma F factor)